MSLKTTPPPEAGLRQPRVELDLVDHGHDLGFGPIIFADIDVPNISVNLKFSG
jgi:hypothetical protein